MIGYSGRQRPRPPARPLQRDPDDMQFDALVATGRARANRVVVAIGGRRPGRKVGHPVIAWASER